MLVGGDPPVPRQRRSERRGSSVMCPRRVTDGPEAAYRGCLAVEAAGSAEPWRTCRYAAVAHPAEPPMSLGQDHDTADSGCGHTCEGRYRWAWPALLLNGGDVKSFRRSVIWQRSWFWSRRFQVRVLAAELSMASERSEFATSPTVTAGAYRDAGPGRAVSFVCRVGHGLPRSVFTQVVGHLAPLVQARLSRTRR